MLASYQQNKKHTTFPYTAVPYGFPVHGCIVGFSRKIVWLRLVKSNNDPFVIAKLYLDDVKELDVIPSRVRTDCGSENGILAASQCFFRRNHTDAYAGEKAHLFGSSHSNQRIEAWWSVFRRNKSSCLIDFFKDLVHCGTYNPDDDLQKACAWYCFSDLIQEELDLCREQWNSHCIRKSNVSQVHGRPDHLYFFPAGNFHGVGYEVVKADFDEMVEYASTWREDEDEDVYKGYFGYVSSQLDIHKGSDFFTEKSIFERLITFAT